jgi:hypothetical protein
VTYGSAGVPPATGGATPARRRDDLGRSGVVLLVAGSLLTLLSAVSLWSWRTFASSEGFADVATDTLKEPAVTEVVADQIVNILQDQVATAQAALAVRPVLRQVVIEVVASEPFKGLFHGGVRAMHASVVQGHRTHLLVRVDDAKSLVKDALTVVSPSMATAIPDEALAVPVGISQSRWAELFMRGADLAGWLILPSALAAVVCFTVAARRARDRRRVLEVVGACLVAVGVVIFAVLAALLNVVADVGQDPRQRTALRAVFWSAMHVLNVTGKVLIVLGAVIALAASLAGGSSVRQRWADVERMAQAMLADPRKKAFAAFTAVVGGMVGLVWPAAVAEVLVRAAGVGLILVGAIWIFDLVGASAWVSEREQRRAGARVTPRRLALGGTTGVVTFSLVLLVGGMSFVRAVRAPHLDRMSIRDSGCNGFASLCDRRLDQVTFAGTHNAMSAGDDNFLFARQTGGMVAQLGRGVRAFLLDLHYGGLVQGIVRTSFLGPADKAESAAQLAPVAKMTPEQRQAVDRAFALAGAEPEDKDRKVYLCHLYCELGATLAQDAFASLHDYLRVNRNEVVILVLEDHVEPKDAVAVLEASHLADRAYTWVPGTPPPTLREMIKKKKNVLIMAEHQGGVRPWYQAAYGRILQDTPFHFRSLAELEAPASCALDRGRATAPLLLINHWLDTGLPNPNDAAKANAIEVLSARVDACQRQRKRRPTILAVDFYSRGDFIKEVDRLNGVAVPGSVLATAGP